MHDISRQPDLRNIFRYEKGSRQRTARRLVQEFPLKLIVNGRPLATLIASPHQLRHLVAGFFRLQGFVHTLDDFLLLGICAERGVAEVRIRGEVPERLPPTLTSGCGTGITFDLPAAPGPRGEPKLFSPLSVLSLMQELARTAEHYAAHGGIHSAAVGDGERLLLHAEDLGRHNTLDRIAGEALIRGIDLAGTMLVTSGRISTEMVAKAARLGIAVLASRTSPTDMALAAAEAAGITMIGYVRGGTFEIYSYPERISLPASEGKIPGVTGVILAGGESRRMGSDKSLLPIAGARFIDHVYRCLSSLFEEVLIVTNSTGLYADLPCRKVPDLYPGRGSLAGIHSGLRHAGQEKIFVAACDMPFLSADVVRRICQEKDTADIVVPRSAQGIEPLHALYARACLPAVEEAIGAGEKRIVSFFPQVRVAEIAGALLADCDPQGLSFRNINTPGEYFALRERARAVAAASAEMSQG